MELKMMVEKFYPDQYATSAYAIDYKKKYEEGYRGLIFDVDNTLVPHGAPADERSVELFKELKQIGFDTVLLSNNKEERVRTFSEPVDSKYIYKANKPVVDNYVKAMNLMGTGFKDTMFVGDQLFTDVWGAKRTGLHNVLVMPINPKEEIQIVIKRFFEKIVLYFYKRSVK